MYGDIDGAMVSNIYDGYYIGFDENSDDSDFDLSQGDAIPMTKDSEINLYIMEC